MASKFQNRLVGTVILVALVVIFLPDLMDGHKLEQKEEAFAKIPLRPELEPAKPALQVSRASTLPAEHLASQQQASAAQQWQVEEVSEPVTLGAKQGQPPVQQPPPVTQPVTPPVVKPQPKPEVIAKKPVEQPKPKVVPPKPVEVQNRLRTSRRRARSSRWTISSPARWDNRPQRQPRRLPLLRRPRAAGSCSSAPSRTSTASMRWWASCGLRATRRTPRHARRSRVSSTGSSSGRMSQGQAAGHAESHRPDDRLEWFRGGLQPLRGSTR